MLTATDTLTAAIESQGQAPVQRIASDFDRSGTFTDLSPYANSVSIPRLLTTDQPDGIRLVTGYAATEATVDLGGDPTNNAHDGAWTWSPTNTDSPFYGKKRVGAPTLIELGYDTGTEADPNPERLRRFSGWLRGIDTDGAARTAELSAIDGSDRLRTQVLLPMVTSLAHPGLDSRYFIDLILTANGIDPEDCDLEPSLNPMTATPYTGTKQDAWTLIQQIAAAELATAFFGVDGQFHFWNRQHFTNQSVNYTDKTVTVHGVTNPIPTVSTARALKTFTTTELVDTVKNHIVVSYQPLIVQPPDWVWQSNSGRGIHSKETISIWATFDSPVQSVATDVVVIPIGGDTGGSSGYRANTKADGTGPAVENLQFTITPYAMGARIDIHNPNNHTAFLVEPRASSAGHLYPGWSADQPRPMLWIRGRRVTADPNYTSTTDGSTAATEEASDAASMNPTTGFGEQLLPFDGDVWLQDPDTAATLAQDLLALLARPAPYLGDVDIVADPRLELGDRIEVQDNTGTKLDRHAWIVGITDTFDTAGGYAQTLTLRLCAGIGAMIWDDPVYGKWDTYKWDGVY